MKFECPHCHQHLETATLYGGQGTKCQGEMQIPSSAPLASEGRATPPSAASPAAGDAMEGKPAEPSVASSPDAHTMVEAPGGERTISSFLREQGVQGGVDLASSGEPAQTAEQAVAQALTAEEHRRYEVGAQVAKGGMGAILSARDVNLKRSVAMKVMLDPKEAGKEGVLRFVEEAQVTGQLEHPGIVPVYELAVGSDGQVYYTMKFVKGRTLKDILKGIAQGDTALIKDFPLSRLLTIFQKVSDAIAYAHSKRVIHRDLKPENIMVGDYGEVLVMDWGLAKILPKKQRVKSPKSKVAGNAAGEKPPAYHVESARQESGIDKTMVGTIMGTPGYMAPEQAMGEIESLDERADIYALGAILYTILTLRPPVEGRNLNDFLQKVTTGEIPHPTTYNPGSKRQKAKEQKSESVVDKTMVEGGGKQPQTNADGRGREPQSPTSNPQSTISLSHLPGQRIPDSLAAVAMKALALQPEGRYRSVAEFQKEIEAYQNGFATGAEQAGAWRQFTLLAKRNKGVSVAVGVAAVLLALVGVTAFVRVNRERRIALEEKDRAEQALRQFKDEQTRRQSDRKSSAPSLIVMAQNLLENKDFDTALAAVRTAAEYDPDLASSRLLAMALLFRMGKHPEALEHARVYARIEANDPRSKQIVTMCETAVRKGNAPAGSLPDLLIQAGVPALAAEFTHSDEAKLPVYKRMIEQAWPGAVTEFSGGRRELSLVSFDNVTDLRPIQDIPLNVLRMASTRVTDLSPLRGMPLQTLNVEHTGIKDLTMLKGMPLKELNISLCRLIDNLLPLEGMPLKTLYLNGTSVVDLNPLRGMPLNDLGCGSTPVSDISVLKGMLLTSLNLSNTKVSDISVVKGMPLTTLCVTPNRITNGWEAVREMKTLTFVSDGSSRWTPAEFFRKLDAGEFSPKPAAK